MYVGEKKQSKWPLNEWERVIRIQILHSFMFDARDGASQNNIENKQISLLPPPSHINSLWWSLIATKNKIFMLKRHKGHHYDDDGEVIGRAFYESRDKEREMMLHKFFWLISRCYNKNEKEKRENKHTHERKELRHVRGGDTCGE